MKKNRQEDINGPGSQGENINYADTGCPVPVSAKGLRERLGKSDDVFFHTFLAGGRPELPYTLIYIKGLIVNEIVDNFILREMSSITNVSSQEEAVKAIMGGALAHIDLQLAEDEDDCVNYLLHGYTLLVFDQINQAVALNTVGFDKRTVDETGNENIIKGGRESFIEVLRTNITLIRSRIRSDKLHVREITVGKSISTNMALLYMDGKADEAVVGELTEKIQAFEPDNIVTASAFEEIICGSCVIISPQLLYTERPDKLCSNIAEGRVAVLIDGIPLGYIVPTTLSMLMQAGEDYSFNTLTASMIRVLRYAALIVSLVAPAYYVAITTFHQEMIPRELAISIIKSKLGVPFPSSLEILIMLVSFELIIEAGLRMPKSVGQSLSIIGAIVLGDAAVSASLISPGIIVVVAAAGIAGFIIPSQDLTNSVRIWRFIFTVLASCVGMLGMIFGMIVMIYLQCKIEILGVAFLYPFVSADGRMFGKDSIFRLPLRMKRRINK